MTSYESAIEKIEKQRENLIESLSVQKIYQGNASLRSRVAFVMNKFPDTRNSDRDLTFKLWKEFYLQKITKINGEDAVTHNNFLSLPKSYDIQRYRAHIQNDLGLFLAHPEVKEGRKTMQMDWHGEMNAIKSDFPKISIYSDESGRHAGSLIIGSLWLYDRNQEKEIECELEKIRSKSLKFSKLKDNNIEECKRLIDCLINHRKTIAFKALVIKKYNDSGVRIFKAYKEHYLNSIEFEINYGRIGIGNPKKLTIVKDQEEKIDLLELESLKREIRNEFNNKQIVISDIHSLSMEKSVFLQIIDLFCGSINRKLSNNDNKNEKNEFADYIFSSLGINDKDLTTENVDWIQIKVLDK